jgi:hypothetical protein
MSAKIYIKMDILNLYMCIFLLIIRIAIKFINIKVFHIFRNYITPVRLISSKNLVKKPQLPYNALLSGYFQKLYSIERTHW